MKFKFIPHAAPFLSSLSFSALLRSPSTISLSLSLSLSLKRAELVRGKSIGRALRRRGCGMRRGGRAGLTRPGVVLPHARGVAVHGARAHHTFRAPGAPMLGALWRGEAQARGR